MWSSLRALPSPATVPHFQLVTVCQQFTTLFFQTLFQLVPVFSPGIVVGAVCQNADHIHDGEVPFLSFRIPRHANLLILKKLERVIVRCFHLTPSILSKSYFFAALPLAENYTLSLLNNIVPHELSVCNRKMICRTRKSKMLHRKTTPLFRACQALRFLSTCSTIKK